MAVGRILPLRHFRDGPVGLLERRGGPGARRDKYFSAGTWGCVTSAVRHDPCLTDDTPVGTNGPTESHPGDGERDARSRTAPRPSDRSPPSARTVARRRLPGGTPYSAPTHPRPGLRAPRATAA